MCIGLLAMTEQGGIIKTLQEAQVQNKNVLLRIDADVDIVNEGINHKIVDDSRIQASVPTIKYLLDNGAKKITIIGHRGRPSGKYDPNLIISPIGHVIGDAVGMDRWEVLENLRFDSGEEVNSPAFAEKLAKDQDLFVQDAFATCHRAHASTVGVTKLLPSYAGLAAQREITGLSQILNAQEQGFTIIIGGKKAEDKLPVIENLFSKAQNFLVGGVVANTFLAGLNYELGKSQIEKEVFEATRNIIDKFHKDSSRHLLLPADLIFSKSLEKAVEPIMASILDLKSSQFAEEAVVDIGEKTVNVYRKIIYASKTIFWNGNLGITEVPDFAHSSRAIAQAIVDSKAKKYAGGGDTSAFLRQIGLADKFDFISNAGGAALEYLAGKTLPGLEVLE